MSVIWPSLPVALIVSELTERLVKPPPVQERVPALVCVV